MCLTKFPDLNRDPLITTYHGQEEKDKGIVLQAIDGNKLMISTLFFNQKPKI